MKRAIVFIVGGAAFGLLSILFIAIGYDIFQKTFTGVFIRFLVLCVMALGGLGGFAIHSETKKED